MTLTTAYSAVSIGRASGRGTTARVARLGRVGASGTRFIKSSFGSSRARGGGTFALPSGFGGNPAPELLIAALETPLNLPFDHTGAEFDGTTVLRVSQQVVQGPKFESQRLVIEDVLVEK